MKLHRIDARHDRGDERENVPECRGLFYRRLWRTAIGNGTDETGT